MERKELKKLNELRDTFTAIYERDGWKNGFKGYVKTLLFSSIKKNE